MAEANMARNGKFGRGLSGWTTSGVELSNNQEMNGSKCAKYTFENGNVGSLQQVFPIEPACVYKVTCWIKWKGCRQLAIARSGRDGWEFSYFPFDDTQSNTYKKFEISYLSSENPGATGLNLVFYVYRDSNATVSEAYIDNIEVNGTVPTRRGIFLVKAPCQVFSKATGQKLDTCPTKRKLYAYYEDGDTISLHWPSKNKPTAVITLDDSKISGAIDPNFTWSDSARIQQVVMNEIGRTQKEFGNVVGDWCQSFVNWVSILGGADCSHPVYDVSGCSSATRALGDRYHPVGDTVQPGDYAPTFGDWVYYKDTSKPEDPDKPADHVGYILGSPSTGFNTVEANRGPAVQQFAIPRRGCAEGSHLKIIGFAQAPYNN